MKKIKSLCSFLLALSTLCMVGCKDGGDSSSSTSTDFTEETVTLSDGYALDCALGNVSDYKVVISNEASLSEKSAAREWIDFVEKVTGESVGYAVDGIATQGEKLISIGRTNLFSNSGLTADKTELNGDGFVVKTIDDDLYICGGNDRGTIYGVYDVIEQMLGVRFIVEDYTYIPKNENAQIVAADKFSAPAFAYRTYLDPVVFQNQSKQYYLHRRYTSDYITISEDMGGNLRWYSNPSYNPVHNSLSYVDVATCTANNEVKTEYKHAFANDGISVIKSTEGELIQQTLAADLCYTDGINEDGSYTSTVIVDGEETKTAIQMVIDGMKDIIAKDVAENNYYMFGQMDLYARPCLCENCKSASAKYTDAGIMIRFVNCLADAIAQWQLEEGIEREIKIVTFAYQYTAHAPVTGDKESGYTLIDPTCKVKDNVVIRLAPIAAEKTVTFNHELQDKNRFGSEYLKKWKGVAKEYMIWTYTANFSHYYYYVPTMLTWAENLKLLQEMGVSYVFMQGNYQETTIYTTKLDSYVASKLMWNPSYDVNALISEFNRYYFGEVASGYADEFIQLYHATYEKAKADNPNYHTRDTGYEGDTVYLFKKGFVLHTIDLFDKAVQAVESSDLTFTEKQTYIHRLKEAQLQARFVYIYNAGAYGFSATDTTIIAKEFIKDALAYGGKHFGESVSRLFDLENVIYRC